MYAILHGHRADVSSVQHDETEPSLSDFNAETLATIIADYLTDRDDIASALLETPDPDFPNAELRKDYDAAVDVVTQAGEEYTVRIYA